MQVSQGDNEIHFPAEGLSTEQKEKRAEEPPFSAKDAFLARLKELKLKYRNVPQRYRGYEALLDVAEDPGDRIPKGMIVPGICFVCYSSLPITMLVLNVGCSHHLEVMLFPAI